MQAEDRQELETKVRVIQIILIALAAGALFFGAVVALILPSPQPADTVLIAYVGVGLGLIGIVTGLILPQTITSQMPPTFATYQTTKIIAGALFEGPAFINLVAYLLEGQVYSLVIAGVLVVFILLQIPTVQQAKDWLESKERQAKDAESFNR